MAAWSVTPTPTSLYPAAEGRTRRTHALARCNHEGVRVHRCVFRGVLTLRARRTARDRLTSLVP